MDFQPAERADRLTDRTVALILAGDSGEHLRGLTEWCVKPAVPFAGSFRIIDYTLSNCINSHIRRIGVLTPYKPGSLNRHLQRTWSLLQGEIGESIELLPQQGEGTRRCAGTADAMYQHLSGLRGQAPEYVVVLSGDHVYKMDYGPMIAQHRESGADLTIGCVNVPIDQARNFSVLSVDAAGRVTAMTEQPEQPESAPGDPRTALASMGIYIFGHEFLLRQLARDANDPDSTHDIGKDIIPDLIGRHRTCAHRFDGYWRDLRTLDAYWEANLEMTNVVPPMNLYDAGWPIWTYQAQRAPTKFVFDDIDRRGTAIDSLISSGCIVAGSTVRRSVLFSDVRIENRCQIERSVILPSVEIGPGCRIRRAIIDTRCRIPAGTMIGENLQLDRERFHVTESGIVLVTPGMLGQVDPAAPRRIEVEEPLAAPKAASMRLSSIQRRSA